MTKSPDGAWLYNTSTYVFYHTLTGGYYVYDTPVRAPPGGAQAL
jgi:hypothetical protein